MQHTKILRFFLKAVVIAGLFVNANTTFGENRTIISPAEQIQEFTGEVLVVLNPGYTLSDIDYLNQQLSAYNIEYDTLSQLYSIRVPDSLDIDSVVALYESSPVVKAAGPNDLGFMQYTPNDPYFSNQWYLDYIEAKKGWDVTTGNGTIIIGIIDTGIDFDHPDLDDNLVSGYDFVNMQYRPEWWKSWMIPIGDTVGWDDYPLDEFGHGTDVAGVAAAIGDNSIGIAGLCWNVKIMPIRTQISYKWEQQGVWYYSTTVFRKDVIDGINYAREQGCNIINMSFAFPNSHHAESLAIHETYSQGCILVASSGNDGENYLYYPAAYPEVIAVGGTDVDDNIGAYSHHNPDLDVVAPGGTTPMPWTVDDIYSTNPTYTSYSNYPPCNTQKNYTYRSGTSYSAPAVSGLAALIKSKHPDLTNEEVRRLIQLTADDKGDVGKDDYYGYGRINARKALSSVLVYDPNALNTNNSRKLVCDIEGRLHMVYEENGRIYYTYSVDNGTNWSTAVKISGSQTSAESPSIDVDSYDHLYVVWCVHTGGNQGLWYVKKGMNWSSPLRILIYQYIVNCDFVAGPSTAGIQKGFVTFEVRQNDYKEIHSGSFLLGDYPIYSGNVIDTFNSSISALPSISLDVDGVPNIAWCRDEEIYYSYYYGDWSIPLNLSNSITSSITPCIAASNKSSRVSVVWSEFDTTSDPPNYQIYYKTKYGGSWTGPTNVSDTHCDSKYPCITINQAAIVVTWKEELEPGVEDIYYVYGAADGWNPAVRLLSAGRPLGLPNVCRFEGTGSVLGSGFGGVGTQGAGPPQPPPGPGEENRPTTIIWAAGDTDLTAIIWHSIPGGTPGISKLAVSNSKTPQLTLNQNYPNPFNLETTISYTLIRDSHVNANVYNILGQKVITLFNSVQKAGLNKLMWDGKDQNGMEVASGIYFYQIKTEDFTANKKMILLQ